jgi:hypothetical protein
MIMRTAVLLCGLPREVDETWRTLQHCLLPNFPNPDVFIYTGQHYPVGGEFFSAIQPARYVVEPQCRFLREEETIRKLGYYADEHINSYIQQIYGLKRAWEVKEEYELKMNVKYDLVIRTRPDFIYLRPITMNLFGDDVYNKLNTIHPPGAPTICTEFAIGPRDVMKKYHMIWDWVMNDNGKMLNRDNHRLNHTQDRNYNCDVILTTYMYDYHKVQLGTPKYLPEFQSPYDYYRIMFRHKHAMY